MSMKKKSKRAHVYKNRDYYTWQTSTVRLRGQNVTIYTKPGMPHASAPDPMAVRMAEQLELDPEAELLALNCGVGLSGISAGMQDAGKIWLADTNVVAVASARRTLSANGPIRTEVFVSSGTSHVPETACFDAVTLRLPKGRHLALQLLLDGFNALRPGGHFYLAGANEDGIKSHTRHVEQLFGNSVILGYRKGGRIVRATKEDGPIALPEVFSDSRVAHESMVTFSIDLPERSFEICTCAGVFAGERLDRGTTALLEQMEILPEDNVLDLGCGSGIVGVVAATRADCGQVWMVDNDINAVEAARASVKANHLDNCQVLLSDCTSALHDALSADGRASDFFDVVLTNPPFHQGRDTHFDVAVQFIKEAADVLRSGGRFYLVANQFLNYEAQVELFFGHCETLYRDGRFKVLSARK